MRAVLLVLTLITTPAAAGNKHHPARQEAQSQYQVYTPEHYTPGRDWQLQNTGS